MTRSDHDAAASFRSTTHTVDPVVSAAVVAESSRRGRSGTASTRAATERQHRLLINDLQADFGLGAVFDAGVALARSTGHPLIDLLAASTSPHELAHRYMCLEPRFHLGHRTTWTLGHGWVRAEHVPALSNAPTPAESMFVCGATCAMFERVGARGLSVTVGDARRRAITVWPWSSLPRDVVLSTPHGWLMRWEHQSRTVTGPGDLVDRLRVLVAAEPSQPWTLADAALELGTSPRTLQRRHHEAGTTAAAVITQGRVDAAAAMLLRTSASATQIALACGFVDLPHLTRHFRTHHGAPPGQWRRTVPRH